jgi:hypothetical protein
MHAIATAYRKPESGHMIEEKPALQTNMIASSKQSQSIDVYHAGMLYLD